jgi:hypothetical protein
VSEQCAVCRRPVEREDAGADVDQFREAHGQAVVECRVASVSGGQSEREAER